MFNSLLIMFLFRVLVSSRPQIVVQNVDLTCGKYFFSIEDETSIKINENSGLISNQHERGSGGCSCCACVCLSCLSVFLMWKLNCSPFVSSSNMIN